MCLCNSTDKDSLTARTALYLSTTTRLRVGGFQEHPHVMWGVIVSIHIIVVQGATVRSRAAIIRVKDNEVDLLLTDLALRVTIPFGYAARVPAIRGPFEQDMMPNELVTCGVMTGASARQRGTGGGACTRTT